MKSWYTIRARASGTEVLIYDEIGAYGVTAKGFLAELGALPEGTAIDLRLNSPGGSVFDAVAIYNALRRHVGEITVWIDGIAASAASYIAMAGDSIVMPENAFLMIHDPSGLVMGTAEDMRATAEALDKVKGSLIQGYAAKSGRADDEIAALMAAETWLDATGALELGLIDRIAAPVTLAASFDIARFRNAPPALVEAIDTGDTPAEAERAASDTDAESAEGDKESLADDKTFAAGPADSQPPPPEAKTSDAAATDAPSEAAAIRAEAIAHARAVIDLCRLAGQPQMAGRFLEEDASLDAVRATLLAAKAGSEPEIDARHAQPGRPTTARPWGEIVARTFKLRG
jgi:ATP-dependent Clp endopeptidase proteolytic subunit ClpP